jgi:hypothetical protein
MTATSKEDEQNKNKILVDSIEDVVSGVLTKF